MNITKPNFKILGWPSICRNSTLLNRVPYSQFIQCRAYNDIEIGMSRCAHPLLFILYWQCHVNFLLKNKRYVCYLLKIANTTLSLSTEDNKHNIITFAAADNCRYAGVCGECVGIYRHFCSYFHLQLCPHLHSIKCTVKCGHAHS